MTLRARVLLALAALAALLALPGGASAQDSEPGSTKAPPAPVIGGELPEKPDTFQLSAREAIKIADTDPKVAETAASRGKLKTYAQVKDGITWQIGYYDGDDEVVQVLIDDPSASIRESWTGYQVAWQMARGYTEQFGHLLNAPYVWIPLAVLFFFGLFDFRRWRKMVHLDLLVLLSFGISQLFFDAGNIGVSVPLVYPPLAYLLCRMLWIGFKGQRGGLSPTVPVTWLAIAVMFLVGFRVALNIADSGVIDVGYAGTIGADRITHGKTVYGEGKFPDTNPFGDTYGPANYYAYVPFELALPWDGEWDELPSAHGAAIFFDLAAIVGLFFVGRRMRRAPRDADEDERRAAKSQGTALGIVLAFAWCAYPYTTYALQSNSNDSLVAALLIWALVAFASPVGRGIFVGLASMVKFAPLALVPLFAVGGRGLWDRLRRPQAGAEGERVGRLRWFGVAPIAWFTLAFLLTCAILLAQTLADPGLKTFYDRTIAMQIDRESPFSIWGQKSSLEWLQTVVKFGAAGLALVVAFVPRRRDVGQVAALGAAVLIAVLIGVDHWFYLYLPWFLGLTLVSIAAARRTGIERGD